MLIWKLLACQIIIWKKNFFLFASYISEGVCLFILSGYKLSVDVMKHTLFIAIICFILLCIFRFLKSSTFMCADDLWKKENHICHLSIFKEDKGVEELIAKTHFLAATVFFFLKYAETNTRTDFIHIVR